MVNYECYRCGYSTNDKTKIRSHIHRKNRCKPIISNIKLDDCANDMLNGVSYDEFRETVGLEKKRESVVKIESKCSQSVVKNESFCSQNVVKIESNSKKTLGKSGKFYECEFCKKSYSHSSSLYKHLKSCKDKIKSDEVNHSMKELINILNEQIKDCKKEISKQSQEIEKKDKFLENQNKQIDELIKKAGITNNVNIQNNYKLLSYKDTDISHLSDIDIRYCIGHNNLCVPYLVKKLHFNPTKPENHNIYISNIKNNYVMKYDGEKWNLEDQEDAIDTLIDDKQLILEQKLEEWIENGKNYPEIMEKFNRYIEKRDNNDVINVIKQEIKLLLFNNRHVIKNIQMIK